MSFCGTALQKLPEVLIKPPLMNLRFPWAIW